MSVNLTITYSKSFHSLFIKKIKKGKRRQVGRKQTSIVVIQEAAGLQILHLLTHSLGQPRWQYGTALMLSALSQKCDAMDDLCLNDLNDLTLHVDCADVTRGEGLVSSMAFCLVGTRNPEVLEIAMKIKYMLILSSS